MFDEFTPMGMIFMALAWSIVISLTVFSVSKVMKKNELSDED